MSGETYECPSCGSPVEEDARECPKCGEIFDASIAFGSFLHDILRIPIGGYAYEAFGWLNRYVAAIGLVVLVVGIVLLILSMRFGPKGFEEDYDVGSPRAT